MAPTKPASAPLFATLAAALLASAAASVLLQARAAQAAAGDETRILRARLAAQSALADAIARLDRGEPLPEAVSSADDGMVSLHIQGAAGLLDLNATDPQQIVRVLVGLNIDPDHAQTIGDRIADWRDNDNLKHLHGAERDDYLAAGKPPPPNRPFQTEFELRSVLGLSPTDYACLAPYVTVYSGQAAIDPQQAPAQLLLALGMPAQTAERRSPLGEVSILSTDAPLSAHAALRESLWFRLTGDPQRPILVHRANEAFVANIAPTNICNGGAGS